MYNDYQRMHHDSIYPKKKRVKKEYELYENKAFVMRGEYGLLAAKKQGRIRQGVPGYLLTIKPI